MSGFLIDTNVVLDIVTRDEEWLDWSTFALEHAAGSGPLTINPIIYAEVSGAFERIEELDSAMPLSYFERRQLPWEAAFLAGKCFVRYRRRGGAKTSPLPDFYIGAHAMVENLTLITRDPKLYRTYFPKLRVIAP